jgi:hypothetical protein
MSDFLPELILVIKILYTVMVNIFQRLFTHKMVLINILGRKHQIQRLFCRYSIIGLHPEYLISMLVEVDLDRGVILGHHP